MDFDDLPRELWQLIFSNLNISDLMTLYSVNSSFKKFVQKDVFWKRYCEAIMPAFQVRAHGNGEWFAFFKSEYPSASALLNRLAIYKRYDVVHELGKLNKKDIQKALALTHEMSAIKWLNGLLC